MKKEIMTQKLKQGQILNFIEKSYINNIIKLQTGDVIQFKYLVPEGNKERAQKIEGLIIGKKHGGLNQTITVRRFIDKVGLEQNFFVHSPKIIGLKILQKSKVRRAKLYYIRKAKGKTTRLKRKF